MVTPPRVWVQELTGVMKTRAQMSSSQPLPLASANWRARRTRLSELLTVSQANSLYSPLWRSVELSWS